jgi:hypothetical protein
MATQNSPANNPVATNSDRSLIGLMAWLAGILLILFSLLSVLNTAFEWNLTFKNVALPKHWDATIGLVGVTVVWWGIWALLTLVKPIQRWGRRHPWIMALIVVGAITLAIVLITVIDNAQREARHNSPEYKAQMDSIRKQDSIRHFQEHPTK